MDIDRCMIVKFKPKFRMLRYIESRGKHLIAFFPGCEYEGILRADGIITCDCSKYPGEYKIKKSEVVITLYMKNVYQKI